jgi:DNA-binding Xre family transcriptional regulator
LANILAVYIVKDSVLWYNCKYKMMIGDLMNRLLWETAEEINLSLAGRVKKLRKRLKMSQKSLSNQTGVSLGSIKRFEQSGNISLLSLTKIAMELNCSDDVKQLFTKVVYKNIQEVINEHK